MRTGGWRRYRSAGRAAARAGRGRRGTLATGGLGLGVTLLLVPLMG